MEIFGGIVVMVLFIAFVMWKSKNSAPQSNAEKMRDEKYWAQKNAEKSEVVSAEDTNGDGVIDSNDD